MIAVVMVYLRLQNSSASEANIFFERYGGRGIRTPESTDQDPDPYIVD